MRNKEKGIGTRCWKMKCSKIGMHGEEYSPCHLYHRGLSYDNGDDDDEWLVTDMSVLLTIWESAAYSIML